MSYITCRATKWRKSDGTIEFNKGYYYNGVGPFSSREKAENYKEQKEYAEKEESGENKIDQLESRIELLEMEIDNLRHWIKELGKQMGVM